MNTISIPVAISNEHLVRRAGGNLSNPRVNFEQSTFDGTKAFKTDPIGSIEAYTSAVMSDFDITERTMSYEGYTISEVRAALDAVLRLSTEGTSQPISNDPTVTPTTQIVEVGYNWETGEMRNIIVPAGEMSLPGFLSINKKWKPSMRVISRSGIPMLVSSTLRYDEDKVQGLFEFVRDWANKNSIYLGQVVDVQFNYIKLTDFRIENVALTDTLRSKIDMFVTGPMIYGDAFAAEKMPRKTGMFLFGPPGGGKTMVMTACAVAMARLGACVVIIDPSFGMDGVTAADNRTKVMLENGHKVGICMEDMEKCATTDRAKILDILDGSSSKGVFRTFIGTTNFVETIDRAMLRPGRFDAVEFCGLPDLAAFTQLVKVLLPDRDLSQVDFAAAFDAFDGYTYAFMANATQNVIRAAIVRLKGDMSSFVITTQDLIDSANAVRGHFDLLQVEVVLPKPTLDTVFNDIVGQGISDYLENNTVSVDDQTNYSLITDIIHEQVDEIVEARMDNATLRKENGDTLGNIRTN